MIAKYLHTTAPQREIRHSDPLFLFYFFNVLGVISNFAKFQQILITTSFSMESP